MSREDVDTRLTDLGESIKERYDALIGERAELNRRIEAADRAWKKWDVDGMWRNGLLSDEEAMELDVLLAEPRVYASAEEAETAFSDAVESYGEALADLGSSYFCSGASQGDAGILARARLGPAPRREDYLPPRTVRAPLPATISVDDDCPF